MRNYSPALTPKWPCHYLGSLWTRDMADWWDLFPLFKFLNSTDKARQMRVKVGQHSGQVQKPCSECGRGKWLVTRPCTPPGIEQIRSQPRGKHLQNTSQGPPFLALHAYSRGSACLIHKNNSSVTPSSKTHFSQEVGRQAGREAF